MKQARCIIGIVLLLRYRLLYFRQFRSYIIRAYLVTLSGDFVTLSVSCYIIGKFIVTLLVDVTLLDVVTLSGATNLAATVQCFCASREAIRPSVDFCGCSTGHAIHRGHDKDGFHG